MQPIGHKTPQELEKAYFTDSQGKRMGRINGTHSIVTAEVIGPPPANSQGDVPRSMDAVPHEG